MLYPLSYGALHSKSRRWDSNPRPRVSNHVLQSAVDPCFSGSSAEFVGNAVAKWAALFFAPDVPQRG